MFGAIRVGLKAWLARRRLILEFCHQCGRDVDTVWWASDDVWERVRGENQNPLCPHCFERLAEQSGVPLRWWATPLLEE